MSDTDAEFETSSGMKLPRFHGNRGEDYGLKVTKNPLMPVIRRMNET